MIDEELSLLHLYLDEQEDDEDEWPPSGASGGESDWDGLHIEYGSAGDDDDDDELDWEGIEFDDSGAEVETEQDGY